ncbi:hypothetical protein D5R81_12725 [Parashewanella spongiae]|uniref:Uncharacterized protein n=2 Tax=Parashewanella spongiae TaxID=342950 RepID=A0A3A6TIJ4_9GAMM|nr:hypothetical protein D5R81_12725 [Parashewanella spongiae]
MELDWLPELILMEDFYGNWDVFFNAVYAAFCHDFVSNKPVFQGQRLGLKRHPEYDGKSATFWHMISKGKVEEERTTDIRRCERIRWPKPIIEHDDHPGIKIWTEKNGSDERIHILLEDENYLVVLNKRNGYILPWTAFYIEYDNQIRKLLKRWKRNT